MTPTDLERCIRALEVAGMRRAAEDIRKHIAAIDAEHRALVADNASLTSTLRAYYEAERLQGQPEGPTQGEWQRVLEHVESVLEAQHPGAALLSEVEALRKDADLYRHMREVAQANGFESLTDAIAQADALRKRVAQLEADLEKAKHFHTAEHKDRQQAERERDEARAQVATARAEAIGEVVAALDERGYLTAHEIRALATTPPPPVVTVAKVREVLNKASATLTRQGYGSGIIRDIARGLCVDLDGEP